MGVVTTPKTYVGLAAFQAADAVACAAQVPPIKKGLDDVGCPDSVRRVLPVIKGAAAVGLLSVKWFPGPARLTTAHGPHSPVRRRLTRTSADCQPTTSMVAPINW